MNKLYVRLLGRGVVVVALLVVLEVLFDPPETIYIHSVDTSNNVSSFLHDLGVQRHVLRLGAFGDGMADIPVCTGRNYRNRFSSRFSNSEFRSTLNHSELHSRTGCSATSKRIDWDSEAKRATGHLFHITGARATCGRTTLRQNVCRRK